MQYYNEPILEQWPALLARPTFDQRELMAKVRPIMEDVQRSGDDALRRYTQQFDGLTLSALTLNNSAPIALAPDLVAAIQQAYDNIYAFHAAQQQDKLEVETMPGVVCERRSVPIQRVGLYIPGGTAPLISTTLMLGVPAQIAGCSQTVLCTPANAEGGIHPAIRFAAQLCGIQTLVPVGGAQAIAALAYGTESVPQVDKIFGPGNQYVTAAKQLAALEGVAIDLPAGPSEVLVYADHTADPAFVAADLLSQAEHGADSQVVLVTTQEQIAKTVQEAVDQQLATLPRRELAAKALLHSRSIVLSDPQLALDFINAYAAEHLILAITDAEAVADKITQAGSVFLGHYTPESVGDYASGTNHTLPTNGYARAYSGVSLDAFVKKITFQRLTQNGLQALG
ncbi:MAG: histidinol dehydrogenase, partial [Bacteroidota bacterium]